MPSPDPAVLDDLIARLACFSLLFAALLTFSVKHLLMLVRRAERADTIERCIKAVRNSPIEAPTIDEQEAVYRAIESLRALRQEARDV